VSRRAADAVLRLSDVATVSDDVEDIRTAGISNGKPASSSSSSGARTPTSSRPSTASARSCRGSARRLPAAIDLSVVLDRTPPIRASLRDVELTLLASSCS
jgi:multidrug efflux pump